MGSRVGALRVLKPQPLSRIFYQAKTRSSWRREKKPSFPGPKQRPTASRERRKQTSFAPGEGVPTQRKKYLSWRERPETPTPSTLNTILVLREKQQLKDWQHLLRLRILHW
jgi:hypothetical protein